MIIRFDRNLVILLVEVILLLFIAVCFSIMIVVGRSNLAILLLLSALFLQFLLLSKKYKNIFPFLLVTIIFLESFVIDDGGVFTISKVGIFLLLIVFLIRQGKTIRFYKTLPELFLFLWIIYSSISIIWSINRAITFARIISLLLLLLFVWMISSFVKNNDLFQFVIFAIVSFGFINSVFTIIQSSQVIHTFIRADLRATGLILEPNLNAFQLGVSSVLSICCWFLPSLQKGIFRPSVLLLLIIFTNLIALLLTISRGGLIATGIGIVSFLIILWYKGKKLHSSILQFFGILLFFALLVYIFDPIIFERIINRFQLSQVEKFGYRLPIFSAAWSLFKSKPIFGFGLATFPTLYYSISGRALVTHNLFLNILVSGGIFGAGLYLSFLVSLMILLFKGIASNDQYLSERSIALASFFVVCFTQSMSLELTFSKMIWLLFGLILASGHINENIHKSVAKTGNIG